MSLFRLVSFEDEKLSQDLIWCVDDIANVQAVADAPGTMNRYYQVGGYQVCHKWLKDRKERRLEYEDIRSSCQIVTARGRTIKIQEEVKKTLSAG